jgi:hypothetical protein
MIRLVNTFVDVRPGRARLIRRTILALVVATTVALLSACGGSSISSSEPGSANYDPAKSTLAKAGLEVCGEGQQQRPPGTSEIQGLALTRVFAVAKDCHGATTSPDKIAVFQFTSKDTIDAGEQAIKKALPKAVVDQVYPIVIAASGPNKEANLAAVLAQIPKH